MSACANVTRGPKRRLASIDGLCFARAKMEMNLTWRHKTKLQRKVNKKVVRFFRFIKDA